MQDVKNVVQAELRGAWRFRWHALAIAWVICSLGWLAVYLTPNIYEARSRFYLDASSALQPFVKDLSVGLDVDQQVDLVKQVVLGRDAMLKVAQQTDLASGIDTPSGVEAVIESLRRSIQLEGGGPSRARWGERDRNFQIAYRDTDRERAVQVVQIVLDSFIEDTLKLRSQGFESAQEFLEEQVRQQEQRLAQAEQKLADFKRRNIDNLPTQEGSYVSNIQIEMNQLKDLESQERVLLSRRSQLTQQLASEKQYVPSSSMPVAPGVGQATSGNELDSLILQAQTRLDELLRKFTPKHPEVIALEDSLGQLRAQRREELARMGVTEVPEHGGLVANPVYEQIRLQRNQVDVDLAAMRGQISDRSERIRQLRARMETMPEVEAMLAQLTRDYDVLRDRYEAMVKQLETAKLSDAVGRTDTVEFSILDPPAALSAPVAPPRLLLLIGIFFLGLGAAGAAAVALSKMNPVFDTPTVLQEATGLPVLGSVGITWLNRRRDKVRGEMLRIATAGAALVLVFGFVLIAREAGSRILHGLLG